MIGKVLGDRYKIEEKIGDGGMAVVYRGVDTLLGRSVTIKILRENLAGDPDVVRSFRREAHAAASLSHPNIVNVYDVGREEDVYYIIMEFIDGRSLKEVIQEEGRISPEAALSIALQICEALQHAHCHNIIHRDIKPHNILITREGRAKVTDFGIARAITSATVTYTQSIVGSVHYFSPEQANGGLAVERSDIYSLGIVLYEMLTGAVPFSGDTPVSIALKHVREEIPYPSELNPDIPSELEDIIMKAVEKAPDDRYASAEELAADLKELQGALQRGEAGPSGKKRKAPVRRKKPKGKGKTYRAWLLGGGLLLLIALLVTFYVIMRSFLTVPEVQVPAVEGLALEQAISKLQEAGLNYTVEQAPSREVPSGHVMSQDPLAGRMVREERIVHLIYSTGPPYVTVPGVIGKTEREAILALGVADLEYELEEQYSNEVPSGQVMDQIPGEGARLQKGETVRIVVSQGGQPVKLRDLTGMTLQDAEKWLETYNLEVGHISRQHSTVEQGRIISQFPEADEVLQMGNPVDLTVSEGPDMDRLRKYSIQITIPEDRLEEGETVVIVVDDVLGERREEVEYTGDIIVVEGYEEGWVYVYYKDDLLAEQKFGP